MNFLSWLLLAAVLVWFAIALVRMIRNKGGCSCSGGCSGCTGNCSSCGTCKHKKGSR